MCVLDSIRSTTFKTPGDWRLTIPSHCPSKYAGVTHEYIRSIMVEGIQGNVFRT